MFMLQTVMSRFSVEVIFVSQYRKTLQGNPSVLCFRKFPVEKKSKDKRSSIKTFRRKILCVTLPKTFVGEPFSVSIFLGHRKNLCFRGLCHDFLSESFVSQCREIL